MLGPVVRSQFRERAAVQRDDEGGVQALAGQVIGSASPDAQMLIDGHLEKAPRQTRVGIEAGLEVEQRPADVMLLGSQHDLLARLDRAEALIAPPPCQLTRQPCVRELANHERAFVVGADEHAPEPSAAWTVA